MTSSIPISDLETKGFLIIPDFLNQKELVALEWDSTQKAEAVDKNFKID